MQINSKQQFYRLWQGLKLGNRIRTWDRLGDLVTSTYAGNVSCRYKEPASPFTKFNMPYYQARGWVTECVKKGAKWDLFTFNESAPDNKLIIQGELQHLPGGLNLSYDGRPNVSMREAMQKPLLAVGLTAWGTLKRHLEPKSLDMIRDLLDDYDGHVVEFGTYDCHLGVLPGHNTVIWEVRSY